MDPLTHEQRHVSDTEDTPFVYELTLPWHQMDRRMTQFVCAMQQPARQMADSLQAFQHRSTHGQLVSKKITMSKY